MRSNLEETIEKAFDYRGDVTLALKDGRSVEGYIYNRDAQKRKLQLFLAGDSSSQEVSYDNIQEIRFTGEDTAAGKSWDAWLAKKAASQK